MKKKLIPFLIFLILLALPFSNAMAQNQEDDSYETKSLDVNLTVGENHVYTIDETAVVKFNEERNAFTVTVPMTGGFTRMVDGEKTVEEYHAVLSDVSVDGYPSSVETHGKNYVIYIWEDQPLLGEKTFKIHFKWDPGADSHEDFDDMIYSVIPTIWPMSIQKASFSITMPKDFDADNVQIYEGEAFGKDKTGVDYSVKGRVITGEATGAVPQNTGITANIVLPEDYYQGANDGKLLEPIVYITAFFVMIAAIVCAVLYRKFAPAPVRKKKSKRRSKHDQKQEIPLSQTIVYNINYVLMIVLLGVYAASLVYLTYHTFSANYWASLFISNSVIPVICYFFTVKFYLEDSSSGKFKGLLAVSVIITVYNLIIGWMTSKNYLLLLSSYGIVLLMVYLQIRLKTKTK